MTECLICSHAVLVKDTFLFIAQNSICSIKCFSSLSVEDLKQLLASNQWNYPTFFIGEMSFTINDGAGYVCGHCRMVFPNRNSICHALVASSNRNLCITCCKTRHQHATPEVFLANVWSCDTDSPRAVPEAGGCAERFLVKAAVWRWSYVLWGCQTHRAVSFFPTES